MALGSLEQEIMRVLWYTRQAMTVRDALSVLNDGRAEPLAYTTVMTVMSRLAEKGALSRTPQGRRYVYAAAVDDEAAIAVRDVLKEYGDAAFAHFVSEADSNPEARDRLRRLLDERDR